VKQNRTETVRLVSGVLKQPAPLVGRVYDGIAGMIGDDAPARRRGEHASDRAGRVEALYRRIFAGNITLTAPQAARRG